MHRQTRLLTPLLWLAALLFLVACGGADTPPTATPAPEPTATEGAPSPTEAPDPTSTAPPTPEPIRYEPPDAAAAGVLAPSQFGIETAGLEIAPSAAQMPGEPLMPDTPPALNGMPPYLLITFGQEVPGRPFPSAVPQLRVLPLDAMREMYAAAGDGRVDERVNAVSDALFRRLEMPAGPLPVLPGTDGSQAFKERMHYLDFNGGSGIAFIAHYTDAVEPVTNDALYYVFQGLTDAGDHYISAMWPITVPLLPDSAADVDAATRDQLDADPNAYFKQVEAELADADDAAFTPDLALLDAAMASITIDSSRPVGEELIQAPTPTPTPEPVVDGVNAVVWQWLSAESATDAVAVSDPAQYTLELVPDGAVRLQADCNFANGTYSREDTQIAITVTTTTAAACADGSLSDTFVALLQSAETVTLAEDGTLQLGLPDGSMIFGPSDAATAIAAAPTSTATPQPEEEAEATPEPTAVLSPTATATEAVTPTATPVPEPSPTAPPEPTPTSILPPTATPEPILPPTLDELSINLSTIGVANSYSWEILPAVDYDDTLDPVAGLPPHILVSFEGGVVDGLAGPASPHLYIIPRGPYQAQWDANGDRTVATALSALETMMDSEGRNVPPDGIRVLPPLAAANEFALEPAYLETDTLRGIRFIGRFADTEIPITNETLAYVFLGETTDAQYVVSLLLPIATASLPDTPDDMLAEEAALFAEDYDAYVAAIVQQLANATWQLDLAALDAVITSLRLTTE